MAGHKVAIITDTHFGIRKGNQHFHNYFEEFYKETFFPTLDKKGIDTVIHMGDCFDVRKGIDYWSLEWAKRVFFDELKSRNIQIYIIVGNHDSFYKNTLSINSPGLNLTEYDNVKVIEDPGTVSIKGKNIFMVPWVCEENAEQFTEELDRTSANVCMGHLELAGFYANKDYKCNHGTDPKVFSKFNRVFSGHFHKKSTKGNITYLGNPYQLYWNDEGEKRGFHIYDLKANRLSFIANPTSMFKKVYLESDTDVELDEYKNMFVKLIVGDGVSPIKTSALINSLYDYDCFDVKVIENVDMSIDDDVEVEAEDTLTTLTNYVNAMEEGFNKESLVGIFKSLYIEAQEV